MFRGVDEMFWVLHYILEGLPPPCGSSQNKCLCSSWGVLNFRVNTVDMDVQAILLTGPPLLANY